ncbi:tubulin polyglutamylase TTLL5 isoform X1 [Neodiprion virginianus]|uniref:Tubulin--tyrosine ligase-like protein 5 n=1 Tax=Neodiprion lecontei TaxID=441921 RepID=A0ABM3G4E2_NEOLC|nr:tubulin polyglutamylase TTLL5 isoform X2 [Neodiprion lecontei]XP_046616363.1 tubulin polyglutamylase TTLL5 isoform X1 [Neodiprion virginianus]
MNHNLRLSAGKLDGKRTKDSMSSSSLSGTSQLSSSSDEVLEPLVHKSHNIIKKSESTTKDKDNNEWLLTGSGGGKPPVLRFKCSALATPPEDPPGKQLHMTYKIFQTDTKLISLLLQSHGLAEVSMTDQNFNILWMGNHPKPDVLRNLTPHQKVNHFPRSYEITRKDRLYKNIEAMQRSKGARNLDFIPQTFLLPSESRELLTAHFRYRGPWIVKPKASSRGRGIYIVNSPEKIIIDESVIVAQYINNPLLVDGHKCDLRLYVAVTSYDPLLIYLYEEGLVRFATVKYDGGHQYVWNPCMHLCNYSINKFHVDYIKSEDPDAEDVGHKWTLSALLRHLRSMGQDTELLMQRIEDVIVKSILATASGIVSGVKQFVKHPDTCFELFGFDILIDDTLKPWLLEVNLTPSLGCDSPLDVRLKSALMADLLTLVGIAAVDPILRPHSNNHRSITNPSKNMTSYRRVHSAEMLMQKKKNVAKNSLNKSGLTAEQQRIVASARAQFERRGGFVRIFPSPKSWEIYSQYLDSVTGIPVVTDPLGPGRLQQQVNTNYNLMLHEQLFPAACRTTGFIIPEVTLDRLSRYERYERALVKGHKQSLDRGDSKENLDVDTHKYKAQVMKLMEDGNKLSSGEARKAFGLYLGCILRKISQPSADSACSELVMKFLQQSASNLRTPFLFTLPSSKLGDKDRAAITAKQLSDFLHLYNRETDLYADTVDRPRTVPNRLFQKFLATAREEDLDDVLILQTRLYNCAHSFLGRSGFAGTLRGPNLLGSLPHITSRVHSNAAGTEQCKCNQPINGLSKPAR